LRHLQDCRHPCGKFSTGEWQAAQADQHSVVARRERLQPLIQVLHLQPPDDARAAIAYALETPRHQPERAPAVCEQTAAAGRSSVLNGQPFCANTPIQPCSYNAAAAAPAARRALRQAELQQLVRQAGDV